ncbi:fatty acid desaturase family protein [Microbacterium terricola]|uniref:Fatty acid desaturase n=1 Tax=Microbacterium terricola TaxID=344163 RepID=A0ABM8DW09_9MICO|nr:acyl-CoA desaturase [Microbacterium terricola]UYK39477.1 acyl-CoA desaturase [Microbacterium terricola]BDV29795.1 fatty acid desaturase [Microbacterium terricola]
MSTATSTLGAVRQTYARTDSFPHMTKAYTEVSQVVKESGLLNRARMFYVFVGIALALAFGGAVTGFILLGDTWYQLLMAGALGLILTQAAFLAHEAAHKQILSTGPANERLGRILAAGVVGISLSWWNAKHSRHHANPNAVGKDPDIEVDTIRFLEEDAAKVKGPMRLITERQGWLFFPLLTLEGLNLHALGLKHLFSRGKVKGRWLELGLIALHFTVLFGAVFWLLPLGMAFAFIGVQMAVFGVYMGASFAPNHKGMPIIAHDAKLDFFTKQVRTSRNISGGWWATWLMGGLNYQVEHHLFPNMPRPHLAKAREIVREHCRTLNVPYTETTLVQSYGIVIRYLNRVGLAARDPFDCPAAGQLRRV